MKFQAHIEHGIWEPLLEAELHNWMKILSRLSGSAMVI